MLCEFDPRHPLYAAVVRKVRHHLAMVDVGVRVSSAALLSLSSGKEADCNPAKARPIRAGLSMRSWWRPPPMFLPSAPRVRLLTSALLSSSGRPGGRFRLYLRRSDSFRGLHRFISPVRETSDFRLRSGLAQARLLPARLRHHPLQPGGPALRFDRRR